MKTPTPDPSPQGGGEQKLASFPSPLWGGVVRGARRGGVTMEQFNAL